MQPDVRPSSTRPPTRTVFEKEQEIRELSKCPFDGTYSLFLSINLTTTSYETPPSRTSPRRGALGENPRNRQDDERQEEVVVEI